MANKIISIENLSKYFDSFQVLKNINLSVSSGEKVVICGPSGSGKSTLIRCINALEDFQEGILTVNGLNLQHKEDIVRVRKQVGMVFQHFNLFPHLTILQNLTIAPVKVLGISEVQAKEIAMSYLSRVHIAEQAEKYPSELSGGQQQRAAIVRSLCMQPKIMLFDEPTSSLDPEMINEVLDVIETLAKDGMTMLCVTHEMGFARKVANRVIFMDKGEIVEENSADSFFRNPESDRTRLFLSKINHA